MKRRWFKLFFYAVLAVAILGCLRMVAAGLWHRQRGVSHLARFSRRSR